MGGRRLKPCPDSPNCVSSQAERDEQRVEPLRYGVSREVARKALIEAIGALPRTEFLLQRSDFIHAVQRSLVFRFTDDLECYLPPHENLIHVRSASRAGHYDFGVNRRRVERLRRAFERRLESIEGE